MPNWNDDVRQSLYTLISGGENSLKSGLNPVLSPFTGSVTVQISGQATALLISGSPTTVSGLNVVITASSPAWVVPGTTFRAGVSGLPVTFASGQQFALFSGESRRLSGLEVVLQSGTQVAVTNTVVNRDATYSLVTGNSFFVGTSGTQFPNVSAFKHIVTLAASGIVYVAGANTVKSGIGLIISGSPEDAGAKNEFNVGNLNLLFGAAVTSTKMTHISFS